MIVKNPSVPNLIEPKMVDLALLEIQAKLISELTWLDNAFGKAHIINDGVPQVYVGGPVGEDYLSLFPDSHLGNFCFFDFIDGETIDKFGKKSGEFEREFSLIFWFDFTKVYGASSYIRTVENVKQDVLEILGLTGFRNSTVRFHKFYERVANVYKGYDSNKIKKEAYMRPYGCFRLEGSIKYFEANRCNLSTLSDQLGINYMKVGESFVIKS